VVEVMDPEEIAKTVLRESMKPMSVDEVATAIRALDVICDAAPSDPSWVLAIRCTQAMLREMKARCLQAEIAGMEVARDIVLKSLMCDCPAAREVTEVPPNSAMRWNLCGQAYCAAIEAQDVQAAINAAIKRKKDTAS
jgi:hypothetical protein